jgi:hypothetical protein
MSFGFATRTNNAKGATRRSTASPKDTGVNRSERNGGAMDKMSWREICESDNLRGRWVAIDDCRFDEVTGRAMEGSVVDVDDDLAELCARIRESKWKNCSIVFAELDGPMQVAGAKPLCN